MDQRIKKLFIVGCILIISLPLLFLLLRIKVTDRYSNEKMGGNFEKNFPLKDDYFSTYSWIKEHVFEVNAIPDKVIDLKNGWLFCGDNFSDNFSESLGLKRFTQQEIQLIKQRVLEKKKWCKNNNIEYFLAIAPNKESVYQNLILIHKNGTTKRDQLDSLCKKEKINYINLGKYFPQDDKDLYHKTDTHWTEYGGYFGYLAIIDKVNEFQKSSIKPLSIDQFEIKNSEIKIGDLNEMLRREKTEYLVAFPYKNPEQAKAVLAPKKLKVPKGYENDPTSYEIRYTCSNQKGKILFLQDSFGGYFVKFIQENFNESVFIWSHDFNKKLILNEKPTILIEEFVERNVDLLLKN